MVKIHQFFFFYKSHFIFLFENLNSFSLPIDKNGHNRLYIGF